MGCGSSGTETPREKKQWDKQPLKQKPKQVNAAADVEVPPAEGDFITVPSDDEAEVVVHQEGTVEQVYKNCYGDSEYAKSYRKDDFDHSIVFGIMLDGKQYALRLEGNVRWSSSEDDINELHSITLGGRKK